MSGENILSPLAEPLHKWKLTLFTHMSHLQKIKQAISQLSLSELVIFRDWFAEFDAEIWDRQFEEDVSTGRLNDLAEKALNHLQSGRCNDL